jgi:hypothetical protein
MIDYKLGVGPMSREIIECINEYGKHNRLMVVASRNQVDYNSGYVCATGELAESILNPEIILCRDHCGPYFSDADEGKSLDTALEECKKTIKEDVDAGFDLIHIDVSRIPENQFKYAKELIDFTIDLSPNIMLEFGSENNTGTDLAPSLERIEEQLEFVEQYCGNLVYFVTQTGSFTKHTQIGTFDINRNKQIARRVHDRGFLFKEHNADYLTKEQVAMRKIGGVDAMNVAPQLGAMQTSILLDMSNNNKEWIKFTEVVLKSNLWTKWMPKDFFDEVMAVIVAGHYLYNTKEYENLINSVDREVFKCRLKTEMFRIFDTYLKE